MSAMPALMFPDRQRIFDDLMVGARLTTNTEWLAQMVASWRVGEGVLPEAMGLGHAEFEAMLDHYFSGVSVSPIAESGSVLDFSRMLEKQDLEQLLRQFAVEPSTEVDWLIGIIVAACLGSDHLWQDLGLWNRKALSAMLAHNFPELAARNVKDMKWKKFLYKQLCEAEGLYVCRAPSCEVCQDYSHCFGDEI